MEKNKNIEALNLTESILQNIELGELPLSKIVMKVIRLARLMGNAEVLEWLRLELAGYSTPPVLSGAVDTNLEPCHIFHLLSLISGSYLAPPTWDHL